MANIFISEYAQTPLDLGQSIPCGVEPAIAVQVVAVSAGSLQSAVFNVNTRFVRVHTDVTAYVKFGANPTATTSEARMAAGSTEFFGVAEGQSHKIAVITGP